MPTPTSGEPKPQAKPALKPKTKRPGVVLPQYLTPPEISKSLRVSVATVRTWIKRGRLKAIDVAINGRPKFRIRPEDLAELERSLQVIPETPKPVTRRPKNSRFISKHFPERNR